MLDYKLYTFLKLCKTLNYRICAEELNMTQPAVTNHIKQLENEYNCKLFSYENRILSKTEQAIILENYVLSAAYTSKKLRDDLCIVKKPVIKIGATKTIGEYTAVKQIKNLIENNDVEIFYYIENTNSLLQKLKDGLLDFALIEGFINKDEFSNYTYRTEKLVGICSKNHHFAGKNLELSELFSEKIILREEGSGTRDAFTRILEAKNYTYDNFPTKIQTNTFGTITSFVKSGIGISFVYESVANSSKDLSTFFINDVNALHEFTCVHLKNTKKPDILKYFIK